MGKNKVFKSFRADFEKNKHILHNKYYALYCSNIDFEGLDYRQNKFVKKQFWSKGTVAAFKIKHTDEIGFAPWYMSSWDIYGQPETVELINVYGKDKTIIPSGKNLVVDKDVVLGWLSSNEKPLFEIMDWYIDRIAQVQTVIDMNLQLHKLPYIIPVEDGGNGSKDGKQISRLEDIVDKILNDELVITVNAEDAALLKVLKTDAPYLIDKLELYKRDLENDAKTFLGINNNGVNKIEQLQLSEVNSNNGEIMTHEEDFKLCLDGFCDRIKEVLGFTMSVKIKNDEIVQMGQMHEYEDAPGPKGGQKDD